MCNRFLYSVVVEFTQTEHVDSFEYLVFATTEAIAVLGALSRCGSPIGEILGVTAEVVDVAYEGVDFGKYNPMEQHENMHSEIEIIFGNNVDHSHCDILHRYIDDLYKLAFVS